MTVNEPTWQENASAVAAFQKEHGRWPEATSSTDDEQRLGSWLNAQRTTDS